VPGLRLGSSKTLADVQITANGVNPVHAEIRRNGAGQIEVLAMGSSVLSVDGAEATRSMLLPGSRLAIGSWSALISRSSSIRSGEDDDGELAESLAKTVGVSPIFLVLGAIAFTVVGYLLPHPSGSAPVPAAPAPAAPPAANPGAGFLTPTRAVSASATRTPSATDVWTTVRAEAARAADAYTQRASEQAADASGVPSPETKSCHVKSIEPQGQVESEDRVSSFTVQYECDVVSKDDGSTVRVTLQVPGIAEQAGNGRWTAALHK